MGAPLGNTNGVGHGAPAGNRNHTTHGTRGWLAIGSLPKGASYVRRLLGEMRRKLEEAVLENSSKLGPYELALVQSCCRHEGRALLAGRWLAKESETLPLSDRLALLAAIGNATDSRDKCLKALGLDRAADRDDWAAFDREQRRLAAMTVPAVAPTNGNASPSIPVAHKSRQQPDPDQGWQEHPAGDFEVSTSGAAPGLAPSLEDDEP